jgi:nucleotide-binding universal stress UspA family protein
VDGSNYSQAAAKAVAERPWPEGSVVKIISAIELPFVPTPETWALPNSYYVQLQKAAREQADSAIKDALDRIQLSQVAQIEVITETIDGRAEDVILNEAEKWGADLIVVGSHGYRGLQRFLLGSVSQAVATHAACSVEIVRGPKAEK